MSINWIVVALILGFLVVFQIAKAAEYVAVMRGETKTRKETNRINAFLLLAFLVLGLYGVWFCNDKYGGKILQFGSAASNHGERVDSMIKITLIITGIVFVATQVLLFWFSFKYQEKEGQKAYYYPHNNRLEMLWTVVPAIVLSVLVGFGLYYWYQITGEAPKDAMQVEVTGEQFKWTFRYPGADGKFGQRYFKETDDNKSNPLGQIWSDPENRDDIVSSGTMHLVVNRPVKLIIGAKDVIHDVGLTAFRLKMDAVPGMPTTLWFTPKYTTAEMKKKYGSSYEYELSCDQMCGKGHYSMRAVIIVDTQEEYDAWLAKQEPQYAAAHGSKESGAPSPGGQTPDSIKNQTADTTRKGAVAKN